MIPVDPVARPDGNIELVDVAGVLVARVLTAAREAELAAELEQLNRSGAKKRLSLHTSHFASCPAADTYRKRQATRKGDKQ